MKKVIEIPATIFPKIKDDKARLNVAAYCRVSTEKEEQENSLETQTMHYKNEIERNPNWTLVDVFVDFGVSGLNDTKRTEFMRMIEMCEKGKIDLILTKSISRFARNQLDCLGYIRKLKLKNIGIRFDKERINTLDPSSEIFLSWFSAFAQAESESLSMNITRGKRMGYKEGKFPFPFSLYAYKRGQNGQPEIVPEEAAIVRKIFYLYLEGNSIKDIIEWLEENEIESPKGNKRWSSNSVSGILKNEKYKGDALLQKTYTVDYLTKTVARNKGEVAQYYVENSHEGIVSREIFDMVQDEIKRRRNYTGDKSISFSANYALTGIVFCAECGARYRRVTWARNGKKRIVWRCSERLENGIKNCKNSPSLPEDKLKQAILSGLSQASLDVSNITEMVKNEIGTVIHKNDEQNEYTIKSKVKKLEEEIRVLNQIVNEADDNQVYLDKIKEYENEFEILNSKLIECTKCEMNDIEDFINENEVNMLEYFDAVVRNTVESVLIISQNKIKIKYVDGIEITKSI
ncbi:MAG: recombinase family protein [Clostridia bacterium]|nr:recombinase family protein [Clostridia bacterium]